MHEIWVVQGFMRFGGDLTRAVGGVEFWQVSGDCYRMISLFFWRLWLNTLSGLSRTPYFFKLFGCCLLL